MKGINFISEMRAAIREGRKTQTRRLVKPQPKIETLSELYGPNPYPVESKSGPGYICLVWGDPKPRYKVGEMVYVKEPWAESNGKIVYMDNDSGGFPKWRSPRFMPERAARTFLQILSAKIERVQSIKPEDAKAEGIVWAHPGTNENWYVGRYRILWDEINDKYKWETNPFVWVYKFEVVKPAKEKR